MFSIIEKLMTRLPAENGKTEAMVYTGTAE